MMTCLFTTTFHFRISLWVYLEVCLCIYTYCLRTNTQYLLQPQAFTIVHKIHLAIMYSCYNVVFNNHGNGFYVNNKTKIRKPQTVCRIIYTLISTKKFNKTCTICEISQIQYIDILFSNFDDLLTVHLSIFISVFNQLDAQNLL